MKLGLVDKMRFRISLHGSNKVWEKHGIPKRESIDLQAWKVQVPVLGIQANCKTTWVWQRLRPSRLSHRSREADLYIFLVLLTPRLIVSLIVQKLYAEYGKKKYSSPEQG